MANGGPIYKGGRPFSKPGQRYGLNTGVFPVSGAPTNGTSGTLAGIAGPGSILLSTSGAVYVNVNTKASPTWNLVSGSAPSASVEVLTTTRVLTAADNGKTFAFNAAAGISVTLPALASSVGFHARFIVQTAPTSVGHTVNSAEGDNIGGSVFVATTGTSGDIEAAFTADVITFVANSSVIGDQCDVIGLAAGWAAKSFASLAASITYTG